MNKALKQILSGVLMYLAAVGPVLGQASLLPNAKQQFFDNTGNPVSGGTVDLYIPGTTTRKNTWQDATEAILNTNPVVLDSAGRAVIYGDGVYRQIVKTSAGITVWDALTASTGDGGGGGGTTVGDGNHVGTILPWSGLTAPAQYIFAYGQLLVRATYPEFFAATTSAQSAVCVTGSPVLSGLTDTSQLSTGAAMEAACLAPGATVVSKTTNTVTASSNANTTGVSAVVFLPWGGGNGTTTFNAPDLRGVVLAGRNNMGGGASTRLTTTYYGPSPDALSSYGGSQSHVLTVAEIPAHFHANTLTDPGHVHTYGSLTSPTQGGGAAVNVVQSTGTSLNTVSSTTGLTITNANAGGSGAHSIVQPSVTINYVIKVTPDTSTAVATGVASIQGMTGVITCGIGLLCTGNVINLAGAGVTPFTPAQGGTGLTTIPQYNVLLGNGIASIATAAPLAGFSCLAGSGVAAFPAFATTCREKLLANRQYWVRSDGNDANDCLANSAGGACATPQRVILLWLANLDFGGFRAFMNVVGNGTFPCITVQGSFVGTATGLGATIQGVSGTPTIECTSTNAVNVGDDFGNGAAIYLTNLKIHAITSGTCLRGLNGQTQIIFDAIDFNCPTYGMEAHHGAYIKAVAAYTVSGGGISHIFSVSNGVVVTYAQTVTFSNSPVYSGAFVIAGGGQAYVSSMVFNNSGTVSGPRYAASDHGLISAGGGATYLPGNSAGSEANLGIYVGTTTLIGLNTTVVVTCGTLTFMSGLLTNKGAC